ncbi:protein MULTIPOLAR SPINDLE 1-like [Papaver somniferum]|uniref:protein MULTIPOLAR SPINDLE 1-like n=1 Tax=Papaver somniferum TaxID=3469 RepID=UPI000E6FD178|nr:protein MULTIPOLAR SPINDLE 1-like [Papaver somniferum]
MYGKQFDVLPQIASCKCHFFDNLGKLSPKFGDSHNHGFDVVLRRRFLRQVRLVERNKRPCTSIRRKHDLELNAEDQIEQLSTSADFLVEQCNTLDPVITNTSFPNWSHQAVSWKAGMGYMPCIWTALQGIWQRKSVSFHVSQHSAQKFLQFCFTNLSSNSLGIYK